MDLILWRHAEAHDLVEGQVDLDRSLTARGEREAARVGAWLDRQLPAGARVLCSPARRCEQTALAMGRKFRIVPALSPDAAFETLLEIAQWPDARQPVVIVGHQPTLGQAIANLLGMSDGRCPVRKGAAWWLRGREREGRHQTLLVAVQAPDRGSP
jgi:phosphohistidine phosphatase